MASLQKSKYTRLLSNTMLLGVSAFSSKVLSFLLTRLYTSYLAVAAFGIVDLVTASANLLIPLVSLGISNAVIRFGLEKGVSKQGVFTGGLVAIGSGFGVLLLLWPALAQVDTLAGNLPLLYLYVLMSCLRTLCCQFVRAKMYLRLYALDGIASTIYTVGFNVLFLVVLQMGTTGYLLSIIAADALSAIGLFIIAGLWRYIRFGGFDKLLYKAMLKYSLPLVPTSMFWWVNNASDRFFISSMLGTAENGLYAVAYKIPSVVAIFTTIFTEAWQLSAVTDGQGKDRDDFFTQVFGALTGLAFLAGAGLILGCRLIMRFLAAPDFFAAWRYVPVLIVATVFSCLVSFLNSVFVVQKKTGISLWTMMAGAVLNLVLNALLIRPMGPNGAALATAISYMLVFVIRAATTRRFIHIRFAPGRLALNTGLLLLQAGLMVWAPPLWGLWCGLVAAALLALNGPALWRGLRRLVAQRRAPKQAE